MNSHPKILSKDKFVTHEMRTTRNAIIKILHRNGDLNFAADILLWIYVDVLLGNYTFEDVMKTADEVKDTIEINARRHFKREN